MNSGLTLHGSLAGLWRYPIKSMMGEELNASDVTANGLLGDRAYALVDRATGKVVSAKNPKKWPRMFDFRAAYVEPPQAGKPLPAVRITLPEGNTVLSSDPQANHVLSKALAAEVILSTSAAAASLEEYWPEVEGLPNQNIVTDEKMPPGTFFDAAALHVLTTATLDAFRSLYPSGRFEARRFRPNLIITAGDGGFPENDWVGSVVRVGDSVRIEAGGRCPRCVMTTLPQGDLPADLGILRTIVKHNGAAAGIYCSVLQAGHVARGDRVAVEQATRAA